MDPTIGERWIAGSVRRSDFLDLILLSRFWGDEDAKVESEFTCSKFSNGSNTGSLAVKSSVNVEKEECVLENPEDCCGTSDRRVGVGHDSSGPQRGDSRDVESLSGSKTPELVPPQTFVEDEDAGVSSELGGLCFWKEPGDLAAVMPPSRPFILQTQHGTKLVGISVILRRASVCLEMIVCQCTILPVDSSPTY